MEEFKVQLGESMVTKLSELSRQGGTLGSLAAGAVNLPHVLGRSYKAGSFSPMDLVSSVRAKGSANTTRGQQVEVVVEEPEKKPKEEKSADASPTSPKTPSDRWHWAARAAVQHLEVDEETEKAFAEVLNLPESRANRYKYDPEKKSWSKDVVLLKLDESEERKPFAEGAMRRCFRMKEMTTHLTLAEVALVNNKKPSDPERIALWKKQKNYVAKEYTFNAGTDSEVILGNARAPSVLVNDIKMQMDTKLLASAFNRRSPPKPVDVLAAFLVQLHSSKKWYFIESYQGGSYVKHNNNAGSTGNIDMATKQESAVRATPQAFSAFTFWHSGGKCIVVDIQGVGDLYTDPQIHTIDGQGYGMGNMGKAGIALFFSTFNPDNPVATAIGMPPFEQEPGWKGSYAYGSDTNNQAAPVKSKKIKSPTTALPSLARLRSKARKETQATQSMFKDVHALVGNLRIDEGSTDGAAFHWEKAEQEGHEGARIALLKLKFFWVYNFLDFLNGVYQSAACAPWRSVYLPAVAHTGRYEGLFPYQSAWTSLSVISKHDGFSGWFSGMGPLVLDALLRKSLLAGCTEKNPIVKVFSVGITFPLWALSVRSILVPEQTSLLGLVELMTKRQWKEIIAETAELCAKCCNSANLGYVVLSHFNDPRLAFLFQEPLADPVLLTRAMLPGASPVIELGRQLREKDGFWGLFAGTRARVCSYVYCTLIGQVVGCPLRLAASLAYPKA